MLKKKITLMFIPSTTGISRQINIPVYQIYLSLAAILILVVSTFYLSAEFFGNKVATNELEKLRSENAKLSDDFEQMRWNLAEVENRYATLVDNEIKIRHLFDLPEINKEERLLGIGGPITPNFESFSATEQQAFMTELEVDRLLKLSSFELEKYNDIENSLNGIKDRLNHTPSIRPAKGWLNSNFGMRNDPFTGYNRMHNGLDISNRKGTPIIAPSDGVVRMVTRSNDLGRLIVIDHGYGFRTRYGHLSKINVKKGQKVKRGDVIGLMGSSGYSTGSHLHYEVLRNNKFTNPKKFILN